MGAVASPGKAASAFLGSTHAPFVDGRALAPKHAGPVAAMNPADGTKISEFLPASPAEADAAVEAARRAFRERRWLGLTPSARGQILWRIAELIERDADEYAEIETLDCGKLLAAARHGDVAIAAEAFRYHAGWCTKLEGATLAPTLAAPDEYTCYTSHQPLGVAVLIVPWNGPLAMTAWKLAPALAAGCTVVVKPPEQASLSVLRLARTLAEAGVPAGVVNVVLGPGATIGDLLVRHREVNKISFTGSGVTGRRILAAATPDLKRVTLELGGKSAAVVFADADLERSAAGIAGGIFGNAGQVCVASSRLLVEAQVYAPFLELLAARAKKLKVGPGMDPASEMGPVISAEHLASIAVKVDRGRAEGAQLLVGGRRLERSGYYFEPTILGNVPGTSAVMREEIFGPVLCAASFQDEVQAIALANDTAYPLAGSVWTRDLARAHRVAGAVDAGLYWVNDHGRPDVAIPFGGFRGSGIGREQGRESVLSYTELKSVMVRL
ncbi:MAG TPA: aldehyde dehydrogenase family protein [Steroidobacteraceae bacterium]|nr:aldehyde dehydrogenase family protein [Steroidobacteraceae bacterium]